MQIIIIISRGNVDQYPREYPDLGPTSISAKCHCKKLMSSTCIIMCLTTRLLFFNVDDPLPIFFNVNDPLPIFFSVFEIFLLPRIEKCKVMDSKMKPLWVVFQNQDSLGDDVLQIFKNGDGELVVILIVVM